MATLETIPAELKRSILNNISDVQTLQNLVHASPDYHAVYLSAQPEIFTSVTLQELSCRGIDISKTEPMIEFMYDAKTLEAFRPLARYSFQTWEPIASALRQIRRHERGLDQQKPAGAKLVLSVDQCLVLLYLGAIVWIPAKVRFHEPLSYPEKAWIEITQKSPLNVEVPLMQGPRAEGYEMHTVYLDDIREGYEKLAIKPLYYWPIKAFWPREDRWDNWYLGSR